MESRFQPFRNYIRLIAAGGIVAVLASFSGGCMAFDVGKMEIFTHQETIRGRKTTPERTVVEDVRASLVQRGNEAVVSLEAEGWDDFEVYEEAEVVRVRRQKRMAFGFFPGAAEICRMPDGALTACSWNARAPDSGKRPFCAQYKDDKPAGLGDYVLNQFVGTLLFGMNLTIATPAALVYEPFRGWSCDHDFLDSEHYSRDWETGNYDASKSPAIRALKKFSNGERDQIGIRTCFDDSTPSSGEIFGSIALFGFKKYPAFFVDLPAREGRRRVGVEKQKWQATVPGPFEVMLSIPGLGWSERRMAADGQSEVVFDLPASGRGGMAEARLAFDHARGESEKTRLAVDKSRGQGSRFDVSFRAQEGTIPHGKMAWEIVQIQPTREGRYVVRVRVADGGRNEETAQEIAREVRRRIREDYAGRHPSSHVEEVHDRVMWKTDADDPAMLVFAGWAFAAKPLASGWKWNAGTRRGMFRVAFSAGVPEEQIRKWTRENIASIVADKNIVLETGERPSGARYRVVTESFENGVFSVEFEVLE